MSLPPKEEQLITTIEFSEEKSKEYEELEALALQYYVLGYYKAHERKR